MNDFKILSFHLVSSHTKINIWIHAIAFKSSLTAGIQNRRCRLLWGSSVFTIAAVLIFYKNSTVQVAQWAVVRIQNRRCRLQRRFMIRGFKIASVAYIGGLESVLTSQHYAESLNSLIWSDLSGSRPIRLWTYLVTNLTGSKATRFRTYLIRNLSYS
jgi:hypothetical protein